MPEVGTDWRALDGVVTAWFDASSLTEAAAFGARVVERQPDIDADIRPTGVRVRVASGDHAGQVSHAAREAGLTANPAALQRLGVVLEAADPRAVQTFWQGVLDYAPDDDGGLTDPLRRDPGVRIRPSADRRPLRNRIHLDVVRPAAAVERARPGEPTGPYGVCHADPEGNEVDLVPGDPLDERSGATDWQAVFSAIACYRVTSSEQQRDLAVAAAELADDAGFPLRIDLRSGLVVLDSGKDQWESDAHGLEVDFADLAQRLQTAAHGFGAVADPERPRFVQLFLDAADVAAVRAFWTGALGYTEDRRSGVSDLHDPQGLEPVLVFQQLDVSDTERRRQRNRIHVELAVPPDVAPARVETALGAGGRLIEESPDGHRIADPEGNELVIVSGQVV